MGDKLNSDLIPFFFLIKHRKVKMDAYYSTVSKDAIAGKGLPLTGKKQRDVATTTTEKGNRERTPPLLSFFVEIMTIIWPE